MFLLIQFYNPDEIFFTVEQVLLILWFANLSLSLCGQVWQSMLSAQAKTCISSPVSAG